MLIGIISDTHDKVTHIAKAIELFRERETDLVLHAGDFCSPFTIPHFKGLNLKGVFGNNDGDHYLLQQKFSAIDAELMGYFGKLEIDGKKVALYHGTDSPITDALEKCGDYDIVISGHTHQQKVEMTNGTLCVNPGTAHGFDEEATIAFLETDSMDVETVLLS